MQHICEFKTYSERVGTIQCKNSLTVRYRPVKPNLHQGVCRIISKPVVLTSTFNRSVRKHDMRRRVSETNCLLLRCCLYYVEHTLISLHKEYSINDSKPPFSSNLPGVNSEHCHSFEEINCSMYVLSRSKVRYLVYSNFFIGTQNYIY